MSIKYDEFKIISCSNRRENRNVVCSNGRKRFVYCDGERGFYNVSCPTMQVDIRCSFPGSDEPISGCTVLSYDEQQVLCQCDICDALKSVKRDEGTTMNSSSSRYLQQVDYSLRDVEFIAMSAHVWGDFGLSVTSVSNQGELQFYVDAGVTTAFFGIVVAIILLILLGTEVYHRFKRHQKSEKMKLFAIIGITAAFPSLTVSDRRK